MKHNLTADELDSIADEELKGNPAAARIVRNVATLLRAEAPQLPAEPTHEMLKALAGDPVILASSDEEELRKRYAAMLKCEARRK